MCFNAHDIKIFVFDLSVSLRCYICLQVVFFDSIALTQEKALFILQKAQKRDQAFW